MIRFSDFTFTYKGVKNPALKNINLTINDGEKVLILGPSGSGKSTLGNCINGLIPNSIEGTISGHVDIDGLDLEKTDIYTLNTKVGTVLQDTDGQFVGMTVAEDVAFALENTATPQKEMISKVTDSLKLVDLEEKEASSPQALSGGQKQRVSLAGVMVEKSGILLFDEPLANLDPATGLKAIELIDEIHRESGRSIIIIEHRLEDVLHRHIDRIVLMNKGEIIYNGDVSTLLKSGLLVEEGIREPLYLSALRKAGCDIKDEDVSSLASISPSCYKEKLNDWYSRYRNDDKAPDGKVILEARNISYSYDGLKKVIDDVSFTLHEGEMVSLLGNNGAGKSTLASIMMGIYKPDKGTLTIDGRDATQDTIYARSASVGYVMQNPNHMISQAKVFDEVAFGLVKRGVPEKEIKEAVMAVLALCGLDKKASWPVSALSYGQKKRVTIASILVMKPRILILDEPTAGQDFYHYTRMMEFISSLREKLGISIIFVTHDMHLALEYTPRSIVLSGGRIIADERTSEVFASEDILTRANLKKTSLYELASLSGIEDRASFIETFIAEEKAEREENTKDEVPDINIPGNHTTRERKQKKKHKEGEAKLSFGLSYIPMDSPVHRLSGVTKFIILFFGACLTLSTFDLRILLAVTAISWILLKQTKVPLKVFRHIIFFMVLMTVINALFIYLFSPGQGTIYMGTRTVLLGSEDMGYALTQETLWYLLVVICKYLTLFPMALMFVSATNPSEFASSLNRLKISYKVSYAFALALRYLPDVIDDYGHIMHSQMCRGVDISSDAKLSERLKGIANVLAPLVLSSMDKIDTITNAMSLRGFGREKKRTWYRERRLKAADWLIIIGLFALWALALYLRFVKGIMFWYPFAS